MFALVRSELLGQFFNTLCADCKYSRQNRKNLSQQDPIQISLKLKTCSQFFIAFLKPTLNLETFEKKRPVSELKYLGNYYLRKR